MMQDEPLKVVVCCKHTEILGTLMRVFRERSLHEVHGCSDAEELQSLLDDSSKDLVLIGSGFSEDEETHMIQTANERLPAERVILHYGGGSGLLFSEIRNAMEKVSLSLG